jgi:hypothetical protein
MSASACGGFGLTPGGGRLEPVDAQDQAQLMDDMDPALLEFVKTRVTSFMRWELLRFLHENPGIADSAENIARYTGRSIDAVRPELDELVCAGMMSKRALGQASPPLPDASSASRVPSGAAFPNAVSSNATPADARSAAIYTFSADPDTRRLIDMFVTACRDRQFRIRAVYHIIKNAP